MSRSALRAFGAIAGIAIVIAAAGPAFALAWQDADADSISDEIKQQDRDIAADAVNPGMGDNFGRWIESSKSESSSHSESKSSSSGFSFSFGAPDRHPRPQGGGINEADLSGDWRLSLRDGPGFCRITLTNDQWSNGKRIGGGTDCPNNLFSARRWSLRGGGIAFDTTMGESVARFYPAGPNLWKGRQADGTRLILER